MGPAPSATGKTEKSILTHARHALLLSVTVFGLGIGLQWYAVSPYGYFGMQALIVGIFMVPLMVALPAAPVALVLLPFRTVRRTALIAAVYALTCLAVGIPSIQCHWPIRRGAFVQLAERSQPLVTAIHRFESERGRPPQALDELVSQYLATIPGTGMPAYPDYEYVVDTAAQPSDPERWLLSVETPSGGINFDCFIYLPSQQYPENGYGGRLERIGEWAYVHE